MDLTHISWIPAANVGLDWLAESHAPVFLELERDLARAGDEIRQLGDLVELVPQPQAPRSQSTAPWVVRNRGDWIVEAASVRRTLRTLIPLPSSCVVMNRIFREGLSAFYWSSEVFGGEGCTTFDSVIVLRARQGLPIAWLQEELQQPYVALQAARRASSISAFRRISGRDLLDARIRIPALEEQEARSAVVASGLRTLRNQVVHGAPSAARRIRPVTLTAATYEERLAEFESHLLEQGSVRARDGYFVQASTSDRNSDLFLVRTLGARRRELPPDPASTLRPQEDDDVAAVWREWYWASDGERTRVFNLLGGEFSIPSFLLARTAIRASYSFFPQTLRPQTEARESASSSPILLPNFTDYHAALEPHRADNLELASAIEEIARLWRRLNPSTPGDADSDALFVWLRDVFRPVLAIKVLRGSDVAGVYLFFGSDQIEEPEAARVELESLALPLVEILRQPSELADEVVRKESLRRLSEMMHQLSGPLGGMSSAIEDLRDFLARRPDVASELVVAEEIAQRRATMTGEPVTRFTVGSRVEQVRAHVESIRHLRYQVRRYRNAHRDLEIENIELEPLLQELAEGARAQLSDLAVTVECPPGLTLDADRTAIKQALEQVVDNSCRELRERRRDNPFINFRAELDDRHVLIEIQDNGLPTTTELLSNPFEEGASTYVSRTKGSGFGLVIVRESFLRHGGRCEIEANANPDGSRQPGVTFRGRLPRLEEQHA